MNNSLNHHPVATYSRLIQGKFYTFKQAKKQVGVPYVQNGHKWLKAE